MYPVSAAYRHAMRRQVRDQGYVRLQFGIFDASAPGDAAVTVPPGTWYSDVSVLDGGESPVRVSYATFEWDRMRLDGTQRLLPESGAELAAQGFVSAALCGADGVFASPPVVSVAFGTVHSMAGLTLDFGDCVPAQITVRAYTAGALADTFVVTDALEPYYRGEFLLEDVDALEISFDRMRAPYTRARLNELRYGVGYTFGNDEIIELAEKHTASPLSLSLPTASLSFTLYNEEGRFSVEGGTALQRFLAEGQDVALSYGQTLEDGRVEWVPTHPWYLDSWKVDGIRASFTAFALFERMGKTTYEKSVFGDGGKTPYVQGREELEKVLADAGGYSYRLGKSVTRWMLPLPVATHAEAVQLLANSNLAALSEARDGAIVTKAPGAGITLAPLTFSAPAHLSEQAAFSSDALTGAPGAEYATFEQDFMRLDGTQRMIPDSGGYLPGEWVWEDVADASGAFPEGKTAAFGYIGRDANNIEETDNCAGGVTVTFGPGPLPEKIYVYSRRAGEAWTQPQEYTPSAHTETFEFPAVPACSWQITFGKCAPNRRARLLTWRLNGVDMGAEAYGDPKYEMKPLLKDITAYVPLVSYFSTAASDAQRREIYSGKLPSDGQWNRIEHDLAISPQLRTDDAGVTAEARHYGYVSYVKFTASTVHDVEFSIWSNGYNLTTLERRLDANPRGETFDWENPVLVHWVDANWPGFLNQIREYYAARVVTTLETRGDPQYDVLDVLPLEDGTWGVVESIETRFSGAFRGTMTIRKERGVNEAAAD